MSPGGRWMMFVVGSVGTGILAFTALGPPPATQHYAVGEDGMGTVTVHWNWDWPLTPAWVLSFVSTAGWAMVAGLVSVRDGKLAEARRWRNTTLGFAIACLVVGLSGGLSLMYLGLKDMDELGLRTRAIDVAREVGRGALLEYFGVVGFAFGACFAWALSLTRRHALRRRLAKQAR